MHRIGTKQYHRIDNEFLLMYGTYPVSVLVRYPDVFNEKYAVCLPVYLVFFSYFEL